MKDIIKYVEDMGSDSIAVFGGKKEGGANIQQIPDEIAACLNDLRKYKIKNLLEVGSAAGGNIKLFDHFFDLDNIIIIDDNMHPKAILRSRVLKGIAYKEIIGRSQDPEVIQSVKGLKLKFDLLILDGDHSLEGLTGDFKAYNQYLNSGGFLFLHDTVHWSTPDVGKYVGILKKDKEFSLIGEYVSKEHVAPCGIAVFQKK